METKSQGEGPKPWRIFFLFMSLVLCGLIVSGQAISLRYESAPLSTVLKAIEAQTDFRFAYTNEEMKLAKPVTVNLSKVTITEALAAIFRGQPLHYTIRKQYVSVSAQVLAPIPTLQRYPLTGRVVNEQGEGLAGATVGEKGRAAATVSREGGWFDLWLSHKTGLLTVSNVGYAEAEAAVESGTPVVVRLQVHVPVLDEAVVMAYGKTSKRLNTGNIAKVSEEDIGRQPVSNPLSTIEGRVAGVIVTQSSGAPGASISLQIRGQNSLAQGSEPFYIIDGVPFAPNNQNTNLLPSLLSTGAGTGLSPFQLIDPSQIESIEILKDADATAIYGSRGANGVVLITTKKGKAGGAKFQVEATMGFSQVTRLPRFLQTREYLAMRKEAFALDGVTPTVATAPDLLAWDSSRYVDFPQLLAGGTARMTRVMASFSGGHVQTRYQLSGQYHRETTVFPGPLSDTKGNVHFSLGHKSQDQRLNLQFTAGFGADKNELSGAGLFSFINTPPNAPNLYTADGQLNWQENSASFQNPFAFLKRRYVAQSDVVLGNLLVQYQVAAGLTIGGSVGFNQMHVEELLLNPIAAQNPDLGPRGSAQFGKNRFQSWIAEPQVQYRRTMGPSRIEVLAGASWQVNRQNSLSIGATDYTQDALLSSLSAAPTLSFRNTLASEYRYQALFGRATYNWKEQIIFNLSGRWDGSSRFGPGRQFAHFGAAGMAWIFSKLPLFRKIQALSFGKLRASYGTTGNDQIGDYRFLDSWTAGQGYQGTVTLFPTRLFNPLYGWEVNQKLEGAVETGFWKNRLLVTLAYYRNRSSNQLIEYVLPSQTGFGSITQNFPALVENRGWEIEISSEIITGKQFRWSTQLNLSLPKNELLDFPGLANSSYASNYVIGAPLAVINRLRLTGVDPITGVYQFEDYNGNGNVQAPGDYQVLGQLNPAWFGGMGNTISYENFELHLFFNFRKQTGSNYLATLYQNNTLPGTAFNQPYYVLERWQRPGMEAPLQRFTTTTSSNAYTTTSRFRQSNGGFGDASFLRLRTLSISYRFPAALLHRLKMSSGRVFVSGQNLLTITGYQGSDPETQNLYALPPLRTIAAGFQLSF